MGLLLGTCFERRGSNANWGDDDSRGWGADVERVRSNVEEAVYQALSLRPTVKVAEPGKLARYEMKARRFRRLDVRAENQTI